MQSIIITGIVPSKKNSKRIVRNKRTGKPLLLSSKAHNDFEPRCILQMKRELIKCRKRQRIEFTFYPNTKRSFDLDNKQTTLLDCLVRAGIIADDSTNYVYKISARVCDGLTRKEFQTLIELEDEYSDPF